MDERTVRLNEFAQGLCSLVRGAERFEGLAADEQFEVLRDLSRFCIQARAADKDLNLPGRRASEGISAAGSPVWSGRQAPPGAVLRRRVHPCLAPASAESTRRIRAEPQGVEP